MPKFAVPPSLIGAKVTILFLVHSQLENEPIRAAPSLQEQTTETIALAIKPFGSLRQKVQKIYSTTPMFRVLGRWRPGSNLGA